jgi:hypothetical protein
LAKNLPLIEASLASLEKEKEGGIVHVILKTSEVRQRPRDKIKFYKP